MIGEANGNLRLCGSASEGESEAYDDDDSKGSCKLAFALVMCYNQLKAAGHLLSLSGVSFFLSISHGLRELKAVTNIH